MYPTLNQMLDMLSVDSARIEVGRRRQEAVWRGQAPDRVPILLGRSESRQVMEKVGPQHLRLCEHQLRGGRPVREYHRFDHYTLGEQFDDPEKMLIESLWDIIGWARTPSDAQLSLRPNFGVGTLASVFGCKTAMGEHDMPWVSERPSKEAILEVDLDHLDRAGLIPRVIEFIQMARSALQEFPDVHVFMPDLQGPMNTAFLLREQEVFIEMLEEEDYFHRLMRIVTEVFVRLARRFKREVGEPLDGGYHGAMYMTNGGVRVVDDVSIMLSPEHYLRYSLPYVRQCLAPFGGGWVHSCGNISHQLDAYLSAPEIKGINFGEPEYYDFADLFPRLAAAGKFCYGGPVREMSESVEAYLERTASALGLARACLIFQPRVRGQDMSEGDWPDPEAILSLWDRLLS
ncbi:MAG TPA: uroporphyrinogen decarboxylase family protein [Phycisphaerae bacterium]|nr:uroporphyrinogen decarboxylase family protein [Phycisphaerae bacterium]HRR86649.1 uroporphyrinogen decarboxylase family protein [Phycisphaerae bacterium]